MACLGSINFLYILYYLSAGTVFCSHLRCLSNLQVYKARRVATMKMMDDGFEEKAKARKAQKLKTLAEKGLLKKNTRKRKRAKTPKVGD